MASIVFVTILSRIDEGRPPFNGAFKSYVQCLTTNIFCLKAIRGGGITVMILMLDGVGYTFMILMLDGVGYCNGSNVRRGGVYSKEI